jgi:hypothetical protein
MLPAFATVALVSCASSANGEGALHRNRAVSVFSCISSRSVQVPCFGMTGAVGSIVEPVESSCATNALMCASNHLASLTLLPLLRSFLVHSVLIIGSPRPGALCTQSDHFNDFSVHDLTLWRARTLCNFVGSIDCITLSLLTRGFPLLGK